MSNEILNNTDMKQQEKPIGLPGLVPAILNFHVEGAMLYFRAKKKY